MSVCCPYFCVIRADKHKISHFREEIDEEEERREEEEELALYAKHIEALHSRPVADLLASGGPRLSK